MKCARFEFNLILSNVYNLAGRLEDDFENLSDVQLEEERKRMLNLLAKMETGEEKDDEEE